MATNVIVQVSESTVMLMILKSWLWSEQCVLCSQFYCITLLTPFVFLSMRAAGGGAVKSVLL